jgi:hypothetical protein
VPVPVAAVAWLIFGRPPPGAGRHGRGNDPIPLLFRGVYNPRDRPHETGIVERTNTLVRDAHQGI